MGILKLNLYYLKNDIQKNSQCPSKSILKTDKFRFLITFKVLNNSFIITIVSCSRSFLSFRGLLQRHLAANFAIYGVMMIIHKKELSIRSINRVIIHKKRISIHSIN